MTTATRWTPRYEFRGRGSTGAVWLMVACAPAIVPPEPPDAAPTGLSAEPAWLTFTCADAGCNETRTATITIDGRRDLAIKRVALSDPDRSDFFVASTPPLPAVFAAREAFAVRVRHTPTGDPRLPDVDLRIIYTDASSDESDPDRLDPGTLSIPLRHRRVGAPQLTVDPSVLTFGAVHPGERRSIDLTVGNGGFGNLGLIIESIQIDHPDEIQLQGLPRTALRPGQSTRLRAVYQPRAARYVEGFIALHTAGAFAAPVLVPYQATAIDAPHLEIPNLDRLDLGEVALGTSAEASLSIHNRGRVPLVIDSIRFEGPQPDALTVSGPGRAESTSIASLSAVDIEIRFRGDLRGPLDAEIVIASNDPARPVVRLPVRAVVTDPELRVAPMTIDFGAVPQGWTMVRALEIANVGYGALVVSNVGLVLGSSHLFTLRPKPGRPTRLDPGQRLDLEVEFQAQTRASFSATAVVDSNDPRRPSVAVALRARATSCEEACPIRHGAPRCAAGDCRIDRCWPGYYDTDGEVATGCECAELGVDPGSFCADSADLGRVNDGGDTVNFTGQVPLAGDRDVLRIFAYDEPEFFSDGFDVRIELQSADPDLRMCVYRHDTDTHLAECFFERERCPADGRYRRAGALGRDDSADFVIRVFRRPGAAATCTPYTVSIGNG